MTLNPLVRRRNPPTKRLPLHRLRIYDIPRRNLKHPLVLAKFFWVIDERMIYMPGGTVPPRSRHREIGDMLDRGDRDDDAPDGGPRESDLVLREDMTPDHRANATPTAHQIRHHDRPVLKA